MGLITKTTQASMDAIQFDQIATGNLYAGENLDNVSPCYINAADGKVYMSNASEADSAASFVGFTPRACKTGEPVTLMGSSTRFRYGTGLTPGAMLYIAETAGRLDLPPPPATPLEPRCASTQPTSWLFATRHWRDKEYKTWHK